MCGPRIDAKGDSCVRWGDAGLSPPADRSRPVVVCSLNRLAFGFSAQYSPWKSHCEKWCGRHITRGLFIAAAIHLGVPYRQAGRFMHALFAWSARPENLPRPIVVFMNSVKAARNISKSSSDKPAAAVPADSSKLASYFNLTTKRPRHRGR